jgi:hypothetical protein
MKDPVVAQRHRLLNCALLFALSIAHPALAQSTDATYPPSVARMYGASTGRAWTEVQQLLKDAGFKTEIKNDAGRFLVTQQAMVEMKRFGFQISDVLGNASRGLVKLHVFVPQFIEPARIYIGSTLTAQLQDGGAMLLYNHEAFGNWLFAKIIAKMPVPERLVPQRPERRAALAKSLLGAPDHECLSRIEKGESGSPETAKNWMAMRILHRIPLVYPRSACVTREERAFSVRAIVGEDGFGWPIGVVDGSPTDDFALTALGSISLGRFVPLMIEGCPAPIMKVVLPMSFEIR